MVRTIKCILLGEELEGLERPPYPGELGQRIFENVSKQAWQQWLRHQTMFINEYRLSAMTPKRASSWRRKCKSFFSAAARKSRMVMSP